MPEETVKIEYKEKERWPFLAFLQASKDYEKALKDFCSNSDDLKHLEQAINRHFKSVRDEHTYTITTVITRYTSIFLLIIGLSVLSQTWLIAFGWMVLKSEDLYKLLACDALLAIIGGAILGVSLFITSQINRDE